MFENSEKRKEEAKKEKPNFKISKKSLKFILVFGLVFIFILKIYLPKIVNPNSEKVTTISKSALEKVIEINDLSTLDYTYNAVADVKDDEGKIKYHVAYDGIVTSGIDFSKIDISVDEEKKEISVNLPNSKIQDVSVDTGAMDYIFEEKRFETETVSHEAYKAAVEDLRKKAESEGSLLKMADDNAITAVKALIEPWVKQVDSEYKVEVKTNEK